MIKLFKQLWWRQKTTEFKFKYRGDEISFHVPYDKTQCDSYLTCEITEYEVELLYNWLGLQLECARRTCDDCYNMDLPKHYMGTLQCGKCNRFLYLNLKEENEVNNG